MEFNIGTPQNPLSSGAKAQHFCTMLIKFPRRPYITELAHEGAFANFRLAAVPRAYSTAFADVLWAAPPTLTPLPTKSASIALRVGPPRGNAMRSKGILLGKVFPSHGARPVEQRSRLHTRVDGYRKWPK